MSLKKKTRFEVFKRDGFACIYCGKRAPEVVLEVDHIEPKSNGGSDNFANLITACFDCNRGKGSVPINALHLTSACKIDSRINIIDEIFSQAHPGVKLGNAFKEYTLRIFLGKLPFNLVQNAMFKAACKFETFNMLDAICHPEEYTKGFSEKVALRSEDTVKYFCGICWTAIEQPLNCNGLVAQNV